jgi:serine/threonine-protein kinase HipA
MNREGRWSLSPAFDVVYAHNPGRGRQTQWHQMTINGLRDGFSVKDLHEVADVAALKRGVADRVLAEVTEAVSAWPELADLAGLEEERIERIRRDHRLSLPRD